MGPKNAMKPTADISANISVDIFVDMYLRCSVCTSDIGRSLLKGATDMDI